MAKNDVNGRKLSNRNDREEVMAGDNGTRNGYEFKRSRVEPESQEDESRDFNSEKERSEKERYIRKQQEKKNIFIGLLIDGTLSFSKIFVSIYFALKYMFDEIDDKIGNSAEFKVHYGLTVLHNTPETIQFGNNYFTTSKEEMLKKIREIEFRGGSLDGHENLQAGIEECLRNLGENTEEFNSRGMVFITDSCPVQDTLDFTELKVKNNNLRFVLGYHHYSESPMFFFNIIDSAGDNVQIGKNEAAFKDIRELLNTNRENSIAECVMSLKDVLSVTTIN